MVIALKHVNADTGTYILIIVGICPFIPFWKAVWVPLFCLSAPVLITKYVYLLGIFKGQNLVHLNTISSAWKDEQSDSALFSWSTLLRRWIGISWALEERLLSGYEMTFRQLRFPQIWVMIFCVMAQITDYWRFQAIQTIRHKQACLSVQPTCNRDYNV